MTALLAALWNFWFVGVSPWVLGFCCPCIYETRVLFFQDGEGPARSPTLEEMAPVLPDWRLCVLAPLCAFVFVPFFPSPFFHTLSVSTSVLYRPPRGPISRKQPVDNNMCVEQVQSKDTAHPRHLLGAAQDSRRSAASSLWGWRAWVLGTGPLNHKCWVACACEGFSAKLRVP